MQCITFVPFLKNSTGFLMIPGRNKNPAASGGAFSSLVGAWLASFCEYLITGEFQVVIFFG